MHWKRMSRWNHSLIKLRDLISQLQELDEHVAVCNRCGMCQSVCPVFSETGNESDVARGKVALLYGLSSSLLKNPRKVLDRLNHCLLCGSCESGCSRKVSLLEIFIRARLIISGYSGLSPVNKILLRYIISKPSVFSTVVRMASSLQGLVLKKRRPSTETATVRSGVPVLRGRNVVPLAGESFRSEFSGKMPVPDAGTTKVVFYAGCLIDKVFPETGRACINVLSHYGIEVILPEKEICCGIPAVASGDGVASESLMVQNITQLAEMDCDYIVTACATCTFTLKKIWPQLCRHYNPEMSEQASVLAEKTNDIFQFLIDKTAAGNDSFHMDTDGDTVITWHDPCHLKKTSGVFQAPRRLLKSITGAEFKEMAEADRCCGSGGSFNLNHYDLSVSIGERKRKNIENSGADVVATACPACMLQLKDVLAKAQSDVGVRHLIEILDSALESQKKKG